MNENTNGLKLSAGIAAIIGVSSVVIVTLFATIATEHLPVAPWIIGPLCLMGVALRYLSNDNSK